MINFALKLLVKDLYRKNTQLKARVRQLETADRNFNKERTAWRDVIDWYSLALSTLHKELAIACQRADRPPPTVTDIQSILDDRATADVDQPKRKK